MSKIFQNTSFNWLVFPPYTGKYAPVKYRILAYFTQCKCEPCFNVYRHKKEINDVYFAILVYLPLNNAGTL